MNNIYKVENNYYKMIESVGESYNRNRKVFRGYENYALWKPMIKIRIWFLIIYIPNYSKQEFYLDIHNFKKV